MDDWQPWRRRVPNHTLPLAGQSTTERDTRYDAGLAVQKAVFGSVIDQLYERSPKDQIHIQRILSANCFGDYDTRTDIEPGMGNSSRQRHKLLDVITQLLHGWGTPGY